MIKAQQCGKEAEEIASLAFSNRHAILLTHSTQRIALQKTIKEIFSNDEREVIIKVQCKRHNEKEAKKQHLNHAHATARSKQVSETVQSKTQQNK